MFGFIAKWMTFNAAIAAMVAVSLHYYMGPGWDIEDVGDALVNKTAIVTGADTGLGKEVVHLLLRNGASVLFTCQSMPLCHDIAHGLPEEQQARILGMMVWNLADQESAMGMAIQTYRAISNYTLNYFINNAAIMAVPEGRNDKGWEEQLAYNYLSHFALSYHFRSVLRKDDTRVVNVASILSHATWPVNPIDLDDLTYAKNRTYHPWMAYFQSKRAMLWFTHELNHRLSKKGATATACRTGPATIPGAGRTGLHAAFVQLFNLFSMSREEAALPIIYAAVQAKPGEYVGPRFGLWGSPAVVGTPLQPFPYPADDQEEVRRLWDMSVQLTGVAKAPVSEGSSAATGSEWEREYHESSSGGIEYKQYMQ